MSLEARVRLYHPEGYTADGRMFVEPRMLEWQTLAYLEPEQCGALEDPHQETMCRECAPSWELDYEVERPNLA